MPLASAKPFRHEALLYDGDASFLSGAVPFIRAGLAAREPVMVAVSSEKIELLSRTLGADSDRVAFADMAALGGNPARIIPAWEDFLEEDGRRRSPARGIGEPIWAGRSEEELVECQLHEALLNHAFADADGFQLLCPYDTGALAAPVLQEACCSHPMIVADDGRHASRAYRGADGVPSVSQAPLRPPPPGAHALSFDMHALPDVRALVAACARSAGLGPKDSDGLVLAVHELAANSVRHAGGIGVLRTWTEDGAAICEVRDTGHIRDPLAGRRRPLPGQPHGMGLWIANQACDLMQIRSGPAGTVVRVRRNAR